MKIAIVTPLPVPLALGGAENLWWGLQEHFQTQTEHDCDIVSVLSPESTFADLISSYETFAKLDLSAYDCVISGKYPAWMVNHPNHVCYMLHRLRGLYDTYVPTVGDADFLALPQIRNLVEWMASCNEQMRDARTCQDQIDALFERLAGLKDSGVPDMIWAFPGPFSRAIIHFLDNAALSPSRIRRYGAISATVARRKDYFPADVAVDVLYPPPHRDNYHCKSADYFFTSSRLDRPKRIDLLIAAMARVKETIPLLIAGTGPDEARLKSLAKDDPRIRFLGYVPDDDMADLYAHALAVPFVPSDEDYGLITIEAMRSSKPVLTVTDSGGPCEFVDHGKTGMVCAPDADRLGACLSEMARNRDATRVMGEAALGRVETITWAKVADGLMQRPMTPKERVIRPKLTIATTFKVFPPVNGGQARVFYLYKAMARLYDIDLVCLGETTDVRSEREIAPGLMEIIIPKTDIHAETEYHISRQVKNIPISDIAANTLLALTPAYQEALELSALTSRAVIASQPYMVDVLRRAAPGKPLWYEAQNVELTLKSDILRDVANAAPLLYEVRKAESDCWKLSERVFACATRDLLAFEALYGPTRAVLHEVPNGVSLENTPYTDLKERRRLQALFQDRDEQLAIFVGSWHGPNLEAVEDILALAKNRPQTRFAIIGSVCLPFKDHVIPNNVELLGAVDMEVRNLMLSIADVALNPMRSGSGTNLKMLDYMAAGIPVISTAFGARGLSITPDRDYLVAEGEAMHGALDAMAKMGEQALETMILSARQVVDTTYSWTTIAENFMAELPM